MALEDPVAVYSTLPTVEIDGMSYPSLNANVVALRMREALGGLASLELTVTDWVARADGSSAHGSDAGSPLALGAGLRAFMGPAAVLAGEIFDGQVTAVECETRRSAPPLITVIAEDRLFSARRKRGTRLFEQKSPADIANTFADDHHLNPEIREGLTAPIADWVQQDETDLAFLRRILARFDADVQVVGNRLQVGKIGVDQRSAVTLTAGSTLEHVRITADIADQITEAKVSGHDPVTGQRVIATAEARGCGPGHGATGSDILNSKFAAVTLPVARHGPMAQSECDALAQAEYDRHARAFVRACGTAIGNSQLRVGSWITIAGVNAQFANDYSVIETVHRFEPVLGYRTDFIAECAYLGAAA